VQREGDVIHVIADRLEDLSDLLRSVGGRNEGLLVQPGRGDEVRHGISLASRENGVSGECGPRNLDVPERRRGSSIKVPTRDFR